MEQQLSFDFMFETQYEFLFCKCTDLGYMCKCCKQEMSEQLETRMEGIVYES